MNEKDNIQEKVTCPECGSSMNEIDDVLFQCENEKCQLQIRKYDGCFFDSNSPSNDMDPLYI